MIGFWHIKGGGKTTHLKPRHSLDLSQQSTQSLGLSQHLPRPSLSSSSCSLRLPALVKTTGESICAGARVCTPQSSYSSQLLPPLFSGLGSKRTKRVSTGAGAEFIGFCLGEWDGLMKDKVRLKLIGFRIGLFDFDWHSGYRNLGKLG